MPGGVSLVNIIKLGLLCVMLLNAVRPISDVGVRASKRARCFFLKSHNEPEASMLQGKETYVDLYKPL